MNTYLQNLTVLELGLLIASIIIVAVVVYFQFRFFSATRKRITQLGAFFPDQSQLSTIKTSITKDDLNTRESLRKFIQNPPARHVETITPSLVAEDESDDDTYEDPVEKIEYSDLDLIKANGGSDAFREMVFDTNAYLCKNVGTSAEFSILQDICEKKIEMLETQISNTINVPLYLGLGGTFIGIITGLAGIASNVDDLFAGGNMVPLTNLLVGVIIAMFASLFGLGLMVYNSSINYKEALKNCDKYKSVYYDFLRRELMPSLSNSMASSLNSLKSVLGEFIGKFGHNLDAYANSAELLNDNIEKQHLLLVEINKMKQKELAVEFANAFQTLKDSSDSLEKFHSYQDGLNETIEKVDGAVSKIDDVVASFDDFAKSLKVVVDNQSSASELQTQFRASIEKHFPTGSEAREMWRKQLDNITEDAANVSTELNAQLKAQTDYIKSFIESNKTAFESMSQLNTVVSKLIEYTNVQAECYKDLKIEIQSLKQEQLNTQKNANKLNGDLLTAVKEMISAIKTIKN